MGKRVSNRQRQSVMKEAKFLKDLPSKYFIKLYHSFFEQNEHESWYFCILMEYAQNGDLMSHYIKKARTDGSPIAEETILKTCKAVSKGLSILHQRNVIHKDIKPQNILIMQDLSVKVSAPISASHQCSSFQDSRHGYLHLRRQQREQECLHQQGWHTTVHQSRDTEEVAIWFQSWHLGLGVPDPLHGLSTAAIHHTYRTEWRGIETHTQDTKQKELISVPTLESSWH